MRSARGLACDGRGRYSRADATRAVRDCRPRIVLYDARTESPSFGALEVLHLGSHDRALVSIPAGVYHAVQNVGDGEAAFVNLPSAPYDHDDPDKHRLPLDNDVIPYRLTSRS